MSSTQRTDRLAFDRADRLGLTILLWVLVGLSTIGGVVVPLVEWVTGRAIPVPFTNEVTVPELDRVGTPYGRGEYPVDVAEPTVVDRLVTLLPGLVLVTLAVAAALIIQRIARDVGRGPPFAASQVPRLRVLALLFLAGAPGWTIVDLVAKGALLAGEDLGGLPAGVTFELPIGPMVVGLVLALLAEAFKYGDHLRDELEGVI